MLEARLFVEMELAEIDGFRNGIVKGIIKGYKPDAIFVDYLPLGKDQELREIIRDTVPRKYSIFRGTTKEYLERYYDRIFLTCDSHTADFLKQYSLGPILTNKLKCAGYVTEEGLKHAIQAIRQKRRQGCLSCRRRSIRRKSN
jgi:predicted glycosyltransferase